MHAELVSPLQSPDRSAVARFGISGDDMGFRRALLLAGMGLWGVGALTAPAGAHPPADDYVPYQPSGFFVFNWSGFYAGGNLGLAHANLSADEQIFPDDFFSADILVFNGDSNEQSQTSITGGVQVGWQNHWGKVVWGVEAGISLLRFDNTSESPVIVGLSRSAEVTDFLSLTGRLGYADGRWLAYIKGGLVNAEISVDYRDAFTGLSSSSSNRETGWTAGLGIDYALGPNLFLGIEYNFMHFNIDVHPPLLPDLPTKFGDAELDIQNIVVRLNYRFQPGCCLPPGGP
jgi:opacity protein-like surface antigen